LSPRKQRWGTPLPFALSSGAMTQPRSQLREEEIAARAHKIWMQRGRPEGQADEHWSLACAQLENERLESARELASARPVQPERKLERGGT
jgi:hypothetical protein